MKKILLLLAVTISITISCQEKKPDARAIMDKAMKAHGTDQAASGTLSFNFRGIDYSVQRGNGNFSYQRNLKIAGDRILDQLDNKGFNRFKNGTSQQLTDSLKSRYSASLNSVIYFAQLPYSLDGDAIRLRYLDQDTIKGTTYHEIEVTFDEKGGGEDHDDVFVYWINTQDYKIDYLAYSYCEDECGYRFRKSVNRRNLEGVIVQDYINYKSEKADPKLFNMDDLFEEDKLSKLSEIKLERANFVKE
jgi:hypothetical protein